uniref:Uncharacterized protein n=1 Tax=Solanum lycopersicum TaxID=4081 RepID=K4CNT0_SOLLC
MKKPSKLFPKAHARKLSKNSPFPVLSPSLALPFVPRLPHASFSSLTRPKPFFSFFFFASTQSQKEQTSFPANANNPTFFSLPPLFCLNETRRQRPIPCQAGLRNVVVVLSNTPVPWKFD